LKRLREQGASLLRAAAALKWSKAAVRAKAHELGIPFPSWRTRRIEQGAKEAAARAKAPAQFQTSDAGRAPGLPWERS